MDTANFVMTYASKSPQKDSGGPVRIYNRKVQSCNSTIEIGMVAT